MTFKERVLEIYPDANVVSYPAKEYTCGLVAYLVSSCNQICPCHYVSSEDHDILWESAWRCIQEDILLRLSQ
jgi:hypothetical protein